MKQLELLRELVPAAEVIGLLANATNPASEGRLKEVQSAARILGRNIHVLNAASESDLGTAFESMAKLRLGAFLIVGDLILLSRRNRLWRWQPVMRFRPFTQGASLPRPVV